MILVNRQIPLREPYCVFSSMEGGMHHHGDPVKRELRDKEALLSSELGQIIITTQVQSCSSTNQHPVFDPRILSSSEVEVKLILSSNQKMVYTDFHIISDSVIF